MLVFGGTFTSDCLNLAALICGGLALLKASLKPCDAGKAYVHSSSLLRKLSLSLSLSQ